MDPPRERVDHPEAAAGHLLARAVREDAIDPLGALAAADPPRAYWSSPRGPTFVALGTVEHRDPRGMERLAAVRSWADDLAGRIEYAGPELARPRVIGGMSFDPRRPADGLWTRLPRTWFALPRRQITSSGTGTWDTEITEPRGITAARPDASDGSVSTSGAPAIIDRRPIVSKEAWIDRVERLQAAIERGGLQKVVLAHAIGIELDRAPAPATLAARLRAANPDCFVTVVQPSGGALFAAATPERLVRHRGGRIEAEALAGSMPRGATPDRDDRYADALITSSKDVHEHELVVGAITDALEALGASASAGARDVRRLQAVQHLRTTIKGTHPGSLHILDLVDALHPTPAVGGLPRDRALTAIREEEPFDRGWYAAPVGWFDVHGDGDIAIGIRSAVFSGTSGRFFAGAGIVADSDPADEWDELQLKYRPMLAAFEE